jgi:hypothetical protein
MIAAKALETSSGLREVSPLLPTQTTCVLGWAKPGSNTDSAQALGQTWKQ